jgi:hypothetical protein
MDSMDLATATVSGDVLLLDHLDAATSFSALAATACAWFHPKVVARPDVNEADNHVLGESPCAAERLRPAQPLCLAGRRGATSCATSCEVPHYR